jgi:hypothetical protein
MLSLARNDHLGDCVIKRALVSGAPSLDVSCWFFVRLARTESLLTLGVREQIVHRLFTDQVHGLQIAV